MSYVLNPKSNRMIRVGGKPWRSLVKEGIIANNAIDESIIKPLFTGNTIEEAKAKKAELMGQVQITKRKDMPTRKLRPDHFPSRRGKKIVEVAKTPRQEEIAQYTAQCASRTLHKHIDQLSDSLENAYDQCDESDGMDDNVLKEFEENLKHLILEEMISGETTKAPTRNTRIVSQGIKQKKYVEPETDYELEEEVKYDDEEDYEEEYK